MKFLYFVLAINIMFLDSIEMIECKTTVTKHSFKESPLEQVRKYLNTVLSKKVYGSLDFGKIIMHYKDSSQTFIKIPAPSKNTILVVRKYRDDFDYVELKLDYTDKTKNNHYKWASRIKISGNKNNLNGTVIIDNDGKINLRTSRNANGEFIDSIYARLPLLKKGPLSTNDKAEELINLNLLFDKKSLLLRDSKTKGILIHSFVPLDFIQSHVIDIEFGNWEILPAIDLDSSLKKF